MLKGGYTLIDLHKADIEPDGAKVQAKTGTWAKIVKAIDDGKPVCVGRFLIDTVKAGARFASFNGGEDASDPVHATIGDNGEAGILIMWVDPDDKVYITTASGGSSDDGTVHIDLDDIALLTDIAATVPENTYTAIKTAYDLGKSVRFYNYTVNGVVGGNAPVNMYIDEDNYNLTGQISTHYGEGGIEEFFISVQDSDNAYLYRQVVEE